MCWNSHMHKMLSTQNFQNGNILIFLFAQWSPWQTVWILMRCCRMWHHLDPNCLQRSPQEYSMITVNKKRLQLDEVSLRVLFICYSLHHDILVYYLISLLSHCTFVIHTTPYLPGNITELMIVYVGDKPERFCLLCIVQQNSIFWRHSKHHPVR